MDRARVAELTGPRTLVWKDEPLPERPTGAEVLAVTIFSAISPGTELGAWSGAPALGPGKGYPRLVGYCNLARVAAVGPQVREARPGDHILTAQSHRSAFVCPEADIRLRVPQGADLRLATPTYLYHLAYNALLRGGLQPGHSLAVIGLGAIGACATALGVHFGARVLGLSSRPRGRETALAFGAQAALAPDDPDLAARIEAFTGGTGLDLTVTTSSRWDDWRTALSVTRRGGTVAVLGFPGRGQDLPQFNPLDPTLFYQRQLTLVACGFSPNLEAGPFDCRFTLKRNMAYLFGLIARGELDAGRLIGATLPATQLEQAYQSLEQGGRDALTLLLDWSPEAG